MTNSDPQRILTARFYTDEKRRHIPRCSFDDLAILKSIKSNATRLWDMRCPDRKDQVGGVKKTIYDESGKAQYVILQTGKSACFWL